MKSMVIKQVKHITMLVICAILIGCHGSQMSECTNSGGFEKGLFQQTWFIEPERKAEYIAAVFDDKTGEIRLPNKTISGDYCIENRTIYIDSKGVNSGLFIAEIISIDAERMVLQLDDGTALKYYNPYPDLNRKIDLEPRSLKKL